MEICENTVHPREETGSGLKRPPGPIDPQKTFLGEIAGIGFVSGQAVCEGVGRLAVVFHRPFEKGRPFGCRRLDGGARGSHWEGAFPFSASLPSGKTP